MNALLTLVTVATFAADPDIEAIKSSLQAQINLYSRVSDLEERVKALEEERTRPATDIPAFTFKSLENISAADAAPTPLAEIEKALSALPKPRVAFVDPGCGPDARWVIAAVEKWGTPAIGIEIDPARAAAARERVANLGLEDKITIITGDAREVEWEADVGAAYLYEELLDELKPKLLELDAFVSYMHKPSGISMTKRGDTYVYTRRSTAEATRPTAQPVVQTVQPVAPSRPAAVWGNRVYYGRVCSNPNCSMCNSIQQQITAPQVSSVAVAQPQRRGHWARQCINGVCRQVWVND